MGERVFDPPFLKIRVIVFAEKWKFFPQEVVPTYGLSMLLSTESVPVGQQSPGYVLLRSLTVCCRYCRVSVTQLSLC